MPQNIILDPSFSDANTWSTQSNVIIDTTTGLLGPTSLKLLNGGNAGVRFTNGTMSFPVSTGEVWRVYGFYKTTADWNGTSSNSKVRLANQSGSLLAAGAASNSGSTDWARSSIAYATISSATTSLQLTVNSDHTTGSIWWDEIRLERVQMASGSYDSYSSRASDQVTVSVLPAPTYVRLYYNLQPAANNPPAVPTTNPPPSPWTTTEPLYSPGSTNVLYTVMVTAYGPSVYEYGPVQRSSSYEAAKQAYDKAMGAETAAGNALTAANGKNKVWYQAAMPLLTGNTTNDVWFDTDDDNKIYTWSGSAWVAAELGTNAIANLAITDAKIGNLNAGKITSGSIDSARIAANTITTRQLLMTDFTNMIGDNYSFEYGSTNWSLGTGASVVDIGLANTPVGGTKVLQVDTTGNISDTNSQQSILTQPGEVWYIEAWMRKVSTGTTGTFGIQVTHRLDGANPGYASVGGSLSMSSVTQNVWVKVSGQFTIPSNKNQLIVRPSVRNDVPAGEVIQFDNIVARKASQAEVIVDGSISTRSLTVGARTDNLVSNGGFEDGLEGWTIPNSGGPAGYAAVETTGSNVRSGKQSAKLVRDSGATNIEIRTDYTQQIPVAPGYGYRVSSWAKSSSSLSGNYFVRIYWFTETSAPASTTYNDALNAAPLTTVWTEKWGIVTPPSDAHYARIGIITNTASTIWVDDISMVQQMPGSVLIDGAITADKVSANSISAEKLTIGAITDNLVVNGGFEDGLAGWIPNITSGSTVNTDGSSRRSGAKAAMLIRGSSNPDIRTAPDQYIPVVAGARYRVSTWAMASTAVTNGYYFRVYWWTDDKVTAASSASNTIANNLALSTSWTEFSDVLTAPSGAKFASIRIYNAWSSAAVPFYVDDITMRGLLPGDVLVSGSVTATQMATNTITAESGIIADAAITNAKIANIDAGKITTGFVSADRIDAASITADKLTVANITSNLARNGGFEDGMTGWAVYSTPADPDTGATAGIGGTLGAYNTVTADGARAAVLRRTTTGTTTPIVSMGQTSDSYIPVSANNNAKYYVAVKVWAGVAIPAGSFNFFVNWYKKDKTTKASTDSSAVLSNYTITQNKWSLFEGQVEVPDDAAWMQIAFTYGYSSAGVVLDSIMAREVVSTTLISEGAITTDRIAAQAITATEIASDAITTDAIGAEQIITTHIKAGSITTSLVSSDFGASLNLSGNGSINLLVSGPIADAQNTANGAQSDVSELKSYYSFTTDGAVIGKPDSPYELRLRNNRIEFTEAGVPLTYWDEGTMNVTKMKVSEIELGNHKIEKYATGTVVRATTS